ncbi:MAG TPA: DUF177 domain-containing protein [Nitrospirae bacterium]|nr:DUF177 domain-containing protein [Nitrospirota bacterium]HDL21210.1 DUF177 domain-containing protein [Nitrospirota bacterium]HDZ01419.1 DUF177 domain-containing protein [Nitrospirota bacterium]
MLISLTSSLCTPYNLKSILMRKIFDMRLNVSDIPDDGLQAELDLPVEISGSAGPEVVHVRINASRFGKKILIEGSLKMSLSLECSRCLKEYSFPLDLAFRDEYNPVEEFENEDEQELTGRELDISSYSNDEIDISELIKEQVLLNVPMKPLCRSDCQGICPGCGKHLNEGSCECKAKEIDPRLAPLKKLKESMKDQDV